MAHETGDEMAIPDDIYVLGGRVRVNQPAGFGLRASMDSVLLAAACPACPGARVLDLGCGAGVAGLCVRARVPGIDLIGVDIEPALITLAQQNAQASDPHNLPKFWVMDIRARDFWACPPEDRVDHVVCNPPYLQPQAHSISPDPVRARALGHGAGQDDKERGGENDLMAWVMAAHRALKPRGTLTMIHRADHLDRVLAAFGPRFGDVDVIPLWPRQGTSARRVIVRGVKDRRGPMTLHSGLVLHPDPGHEGTQNWTIDAAKILKDMGGLYVEAEESP